MRKNRGKSGVKIWGMLGRFLEFGSMLKVGVFVLMFVVGVEVSMAETATLAPTLLPQTDMSVTDCNAKIDEILFAAKIDGSKITNDVLACAIVTGRMSLDLLPYFLKYMSNFALGIVGILAVLFVVIGGYFYAFSGIMDYKEKGKKFITHALGGVIIAFLSWSIVTVILNLFTGS